MKKKIYLLGLVFLALGSLNASTKAAAAEYYQPKVSRIAGKNRRDTALEVSKFVKENKRVLIARDDDYADALSASSLQGNSPIFLVHKKIAPTSVLKRLKEIQPEEIILLGGETAISKEHEQLFIDTFGKEKVKRLFGKDRYETSLKINNFSNRKSFYIASGENYPDALSATSLAFKKNAGILLSRQHALPASIKNSLENYPNPTLIGGESALSSQVAKELTAMGKTPKRIFGRNRYETALAIAKESDPSPVLFIASGENFPDALTASSMASQYNAPILLSPGNTLPVSVGNYIKANKPKEIILLGGETVLSQNVENQLKNIGIPESRQKIEAGAYIKITKDTPLYKDRTKTEQIHEIPAGKFAYVSKIEGNFLSLKYNGVSGYSGTLDYSVMNPDQESSYISGPFVSQVYPDDIPMACESAAALMALKRKGYAMDVSLPAFVSKLPKTSRNPELGFVGDPYKVVSGYYMTINPKPMTAYANTYGKAQDLSGSSLDYIRMELLNGNPIAFWSIYNFNNPIYFNYWNGTAIARGIDNAHSVTLVGYDAKGKEYIVADPYNPKSPKNIYEYRVKEETIERIYKLQKYAMVIR